MRKSLDETLANMFTNPIYNKSYIFYACVIGKCKINIDNNSNYVAYIKFDKTKYILTINDNMFSSHSLVKRMGILKHECLHIINKHVFRFKGLDNKRAKLACDCSINQFIEPSHLLDDAIDLEYLEYLANKSLKPLQSAEYYYNMLEDVNLDDENVSDNWDESEFSEDIIETVTEKIIVDSLNETKTMQGDNPHGLIKSLSIKKGKKVTWKRALKRVISSVSGSKKPSIKRPNRRFPERRDVKGNTRDLKFDLLVVWDVSGSVSNKTSINLLNEIKSLHSANTKLSKMMLIQVDTEAYKPQEFTNKTKMITRLSNGGTYLNPALERAKREKIHYDCIVVLTDGYLDHSDIMKFTKCKKPVIWIISKNGNKNNTVLNSSTSKHFYVVRL